MSSHAIRPARRANGRKFYVTIALAAALIVAIGFGPTFYLKPLFGAPPLTALATLHGFLFTAWIFLLIVQTTLVAKGRTDIHRKLGIAGAVLAAAMVVIGLKTAIAFAARGMSPPGAPPALSFFAIPFFSITLFAIFVTLAIALRRDTATHKRLMVLATAAILGAAIARLPFAAAGIPPVFFAITDLFLIAGIIHDWRTMGRVHTAYIWGGFLLVASQPFQLVILGTEPWINFARWLTS